MLGIMPRIVFPKAGRPTGGSLIDFNSARFINGHVGYVLNKYIPVETQSIHSFSLVCS